MTSTQDQIPEGLLEHVLQKLQLSSRPVADLTGLARVYAAWCHHVPFDNVRKLIHVRSNNPATLPGDNAVDFFNSWLKHGTGGTCWAGNGALHALLKTLGFNATRGIATMLVVPDLPPNHGTVLVELNDSLYLTDASILHEAPLLLVPEDNRGGAEPTRFNVKVSLTQESKWNIWWLPLHLPEGLNCRIDSYPASQADFQRQHEQTRGWSPFNYALTIRKLHGDKTVGFGFGTWVELSQNGVQNKREISAQERLSLLIDKLGYSEEIASSLPEDKPTPPPPGSASARDHAESLH